MALHNVICGTILSSLFRSLPSSAPRPDEKATRLSRATVVEPSNGHVWKGQSSRRMTNCVYIVIKSVACRKYVTISSGSDIFQWKQKTLPYNTVAFIKVLHCIYINSFTNSSIFCQIFFLINFIERCDNWNYRLNIHKFYVLVKNRLNKFILIMEME